MRPISKRIALISASALLCGTTVYPQVPQSSSAEFNKFRQQMLSDFADFKKKVLDDYASFLDGEWKEFEPIIEVRRPDIKPKPKKAPKADEVKQEEPAPEVAKLPAPNFNKATLPGLNTAPSPASGSIRGQKNPNGVKVPRTQLPTPGFGGSGLLTGADKPDTPFLDGNSGKCNYDYAISKLPDPDFAFGSLPGQTAAPSPGEGCLLNPGELAPVKYEHTPAKLNEPEFGFGSMPGSTSAPKPGGLLAGNGEVAPAKYEITDDRYKFDFYGMDAYLPKCDFSIASSISDLTKEGGTHWKKLAAQEEALEAARQLFGLSQELGLNGYLTFRLAEQYVDSKFPNSNAAARTSAVHFLLSNMGYDARLGVIGGKLPVVMMPFDQEKVYSAMQLTQNNGRTYTILEPNGMTLDDLQKYGNMVNTCQLPADAKGKTSDLRLTGLDLPMKAKSFEVTGGDITLRGEVNENMMKMLHHYPQMPVGDFASSWVDASLRDDLVGQVKSQLKGMGDKDAINKLMRFFHYGFEYATDQEAHGFEKPYFLEENFLYGTNDCEDRSIFFSYLVWNSLGLPCQLIQYPNHESTAVAVKEPVNGYYYTLDGVNFYSADPTYIGSSIGQVQTTYRGSNPTIDKLYK